MVGAYLVIAEPICRHNEENHSVLPHLCRCPVPNVLAPIVALPDYREQWDLSSSSKFWIFTPRTLSGVTMPIPRVSSVEIHHKGDFSP